MRDMPLSHPRASAFVRANAGSGKTKTLIDRVARLLLDGCDPAAVLCLTYTKAAAAEMQRRLFETLGQWATAPDEALRADLAALEDRPLAELTARDLQQARGLFARALEVPGGLRIQTLHAFAQTILHRFPLEAGVWPGFEVLDDEVIRTLHQDSLRQLEHMALSQPGPLQDAYARMALRLNEQALLEMIIQTLYRRDDIARAFDQAGSEAACLRAVWARFGLPGVQDPDDAIIEAMRDISSQRLRQWAEVLQGGKATDCKTAVALLAAAASANDPAALYAALCDVVLTAKRQPRASLMTKDLGRAHPQVQAALEDLAQRIITLVDRLSDIGCAQTTADVLLIGRAVGAIYGAAKRQRGGLDFHDMITATARLLSDPAVTDWVLYKLDTRLCHILVDEAQDTAPVQWHIVRALSARFFDEEPGQAAARTIFAVGDVKQSIYGFQGADPVAFTAASQHHQAQVMATGHVWSTSDLTTSYRTVDAVLQVVDAALAHPGCAGFAPLADGAAHPPHLSHRATLGHAGCVEIWPAVVADASEEVDWRAPVDRPAPESGKQRLARQIARFIQRSLRDGDAVYDKASKTQRPLRAGDVMVLVRSRDALYHALLREMKDLALPVAGADRLRLMGATAIQDMITCAMVCLNPLDDLSLAVLLRSPLCDVDEDLLFELAHVGPAPARPPGTSLWARLQSCCDHPAVAGACDLVRTAQAHVAHGPFRFFQAVLQHTDAQGRSMRARLRGRLSSETEDALDAFGDLCLHQEDLYGGDLRGFCLRNRHNDTEIKRDMEAAGDAIRILTIHAAKGLEAPLVILPQTAQGLRGGNRGSLALYPDADLGLVAAGSDSRALQADKDAQTALQQAEDKRLMYVAATRARDRLVICGYFEKRQKNPRANSWYDIMQSTLQTMGAQTVHDPLLGAVLRWGAAPVHLSRSQQQAVAADVPGWLHTPLPRDLTSETERATAHVALSPLEDRSRFLRGTLIHRLLAVLPQQPPHTHVQAAADLLAHETELDAARKAEIIGAARTVLDHAEAHPLFGPDARAEVAVAAQLDGHWVQGRIDRLLITPDRILIGDIKTNRPGAPHPAAMDISILRQLATYVRILRAAYAARPISVFVIWTDGPQVMEVPLSLLADQLTYTTEGA